MDYFARDCRDISRAALQDREVFINCGALVLLSIQQPFHAMPVQMQDVWANGRESKYLFGSKRAGYDFIVEHASRLQIMAREYRNGRIDLETYVLALLETPNMGIVKASFMAQLTVADGACLDTHNLRRLGLEETAFRLPKTLKIDSVHSRIRSYCAVWRAEGSSAFWWNSWCDYLAAQGRNKFTSGEQVSRWHRLALGETVA